MVYERLQEWISSMHFTSYDEGYNWIRNNQNGKVFKAQYLALDAYFHEFVELPFVELQPSEFLQQIQQGLKPPTEPTQPIPRPPEYTEEPTNPITRLFNALRGLFR